MDHFGYNLSGSTDSAASATAMGAGIKTYNNAIGVDADGNPVESVAERAKSLGKSAGVVSSVPWSHATPAALVAHNASRHDYHGISTEMAASDMDVIIGAGHPFYDADHQQLETPSYSYLSESTFTALADGQTDFTLLETNEEFADLTTTSSRTTPRSTTCRRSPS